MLQLELNPRLPTPLYRQVMDGIRAAIASGALQPGEQLPSIRELATRLGINPSSAVKAYSELQHAGVIQLDQGRGTFVREDHRVVIHSRTELLRDAVEALVTKAAVLGATDDEVLGAVSARLKRRKKESK